jgi:NitT/TauT family transport system ATP-binding protein
VKEAQLDNVTKRFDDGTVAVQDLSIDVARGEFVSLVGPSGCGKSTILRMLAGLEEPTTGAVRTTGERPGYVFQDPTLLPWRSVLDNVALPAEIEGTRRNIARHAARQAIARVGLTEFEDHKPAQLSGGMRMRVSIARAMTSQSKLFLFDEPFGALDELTRERLNEQLSSLFMADPFAGLFVTHSVNEAVFLSTRVVVLAPRPGRIVLDLPIPFEFPRLPTLRHEPEFAAIAGEVSAALRAGFEEAA